ncbi:MAG: 1-acyl-sn-glycerol-3-phosphate acyltransferase [Lentisphaeria bacterium]|nr:1-acyl-sn-glycerol-3-phosphate acyltransferase [Lentisphaeria bacterium]
MTNKEPEHLAKTKFAIGILEKIMKARLTVTGTENLGKDPCMYVMNHFTRAETLFLPYVLHEQTGKYPRSLADKTLFSGAIGDYMLSMGVLPTNEPKRDDMILHDLMTSSSDWIIYPEGAMVKSKRIFKKGKFMINTPERIGPPRTGAATLAMKSEIYKKDYLSFLENNNDKKARAFEERFNISGPDDLSTDCSVVIPTTITYYPLRPGQNFIRKLITKFFDDISPRLDEELQVEGNILLNKTDINIHFGEPIPVKNYLKSYSFISSWVPFFKSVENNNLLLKRGARSLTNDFMSDIYRHARINLDHIVCSSLRYIKESEVSESRFNRIVFLTIQELKKYPERYRLHPVLDKDYGKIICGESIEELESIYDLAVSKGVIVRENGVMKIKNMKMNMMHMFHQVRVNNPLVVIANEFEPFKDCISFIKKMLSKSDESLNHYTMES